MLLLIDAGNTRIKWALVEPNGQLGVWAHIGSMTHQELGQIPSPWQNLAITQAVVSNVAGVALREQLARQLVAYRVEWFCAQHQRAGIQSGYRVPESLGSDRFASMIGARALFPQQKLIVATCGTATTIDAVNSEGHFVGGMIVPGLQLMAQSLAHNTAQLPLASLPAAAISPFADHTAAAIASGCLHAQAGAIERAVSEFSDTTVPRCILSGGAASYIAPNLRVPHQLVDNLVLIGLQVATC